LSKVDPAISVEASRNVRRSICTSCWCVAETLENSDQVSSMRSVGVTLARRFNARGVRGKLFASRSDD